MEQIDKTRIRDRMLALEKAELETAREHFEAHLTDSILADAEPHEKDEMAAARSAADLAHALEGPIHSHDAKVAAIAAMDTGPMTSVGPGAAVRFDGKNYIVIVSTKAFECGGQTFMGISQDSPIYHKLMGLEAGETFDQNGRTVNLDAVW